ncbi:MAG: DinI-like family protein [Serratia proteamaculans]
MRVEIMIDKEQKISPALLEVLESERHRKLNPLYLTTAIRNRKGIVNGIELSGLKMSEEKERVMKMLQQAWEGDSWIH